MPLSTWIHIIFGILVIIEFFRFFGMSVGEGLGGGSGGGLATRAAKAYGDVAKAQALTKKERAEAREIEGEAQLQRKMVDDEEKAIKEIEELLKKQERYGADEIGRLQWVDQVLERITRIRNAIEANKYKKMVLEQLAVLSKEITAEYQLENIMRRVERKLEQFGSVEFKELKREEHIGKVLDRLINKQIRLAKKEESITVARLKRQEKITYDQWVAQLKGIIEEKNNLINRIRIEVQEKVTGPEEDFNRLIRQIIDDVAAGRLTDASKNIQEAIALKKRQLQYEQQIRYYEGTIRNLEGKQRQIESAIIEFVNRFELREPRGTEASEGGMRRTARRMSRLRRTT